MDKECLLDHPQKFANQVLNRCDSTNDTARILAERGSPHGTWVSTRIQESGRGRLGRKWDSMEGTLFLSLIARIENKALWSWVPLTTALGIIRFLRTQYPGTGFQVKWPNDIVLGGAKLGGILCEGAGSSHPYIVIGMGINCLSSPKDLDQSATDLTSALGRGPIVADDIRISLIQSVLQELDRLTLGPQLIRESYDLWTALPKGTPVEWGVRQMGYVVNLGPSSELQVKNESGVQFSLFAEDVQVRKKFADRGAIGSGDSQKLI